MKRNSLGQKVYESKNFTVGTDPMMVCPATGEGGLSVGLLILLEQIKEKCDGAAVTINSGARSVQHNAAVGGSTKSEHLVNVDNPYSDAADISVKGVSTKALHTIVKNLPYANLLGIGYYPEDKFVHVDVRGYGARWVG